MYSYSSSSEIKPKEKDQPLDTVSSIVWDTYHSDPSFLASSWDGYLRYYQLNSKNELQKVWQMFLQHPVLCCDIGQDNIVFGGLASGDVMAVSLQNGACIHLGNHQAPIAGIFWMKAFKCLMTLGFDNLINFWTLESNNGNYFQMQIKLPYKTYTASFDYPYLVIGSSQSTIAIINMKNLPNINPPKEYIKTSIQKYSKFNCSRIFADGKKIVMGTADGRSIISSFVDNYQLKLDSNPQPLITRTQKRQDSRATLYGQLNCVDIGIHNYQNYFVIGGTEDLGIYNLNKRCKTKTISNTSSNLGAITAMRINPNNKYIAYAMGSDWTKGLLELDSIKKPKIIVFKLSSTDLNDFVAK